MTKILMKLKKDSHRDFLTTPSGYTIDKKWSEVDDSDVTIEGYLSNRTDIDFKEVKKSFKDSPSSPTKETFVESTHDDE